MNKWVYILLLVCSASFQVYAFDSSETQKLPSPSEENSGFFGGEWYISWGYSKDFWQPSNIHISQPVLGNNFTVHKVRAEDVPQWDSGYGPFDAGITEPQWNLRIGRFVDAARSLAIEFNFDHSKYSSNLNQTARITGLVAGQAVDMRQQLTATYFKFNLHNGANHIMMNVVKRFPLFGEINQNYSFAGIAKLGAGIMLPHADNTIMGNDNDVGSLSLNNFIGYRSGWWQLNGWTTGIEVGVRFVFYKPFYAEFALKQAYASLFNIPVYSGVADQKLWMSELILSVGYTFNSG